MPEQKPRPGLPLRQRAPQCFHTRDAAEQQYLIFFLNILMARVKVDISGQARLEASIANSASTKTIAEARSFAACLDTGKLRTT
ncbi:hypothetical protein [Neorhizobium sp. NCHU2750]|uniref:hypothetical protein n=1 Tax=Neorhizobium sp. NCHU2750 TaxID=1825976 RepID=UPI0013C516DE